MRNLRFATLPRFSSTSGLASVEHFQQERLNTLRSGLPSGQKGGFIPLTAIDDPFNENGMIIKITNFANSRDINIRWRYFSAIVKFLVQVAGQSFNGSPFAADESPSSHCLTNHFHRSSGGTEPGILGIYTPGGKGGRGFFLTNPQHCSIFWVMDSPRQAWWEPSQGYNPLHVAHEVGENQSNEGMECDFVAVQREERSR